MPERSSDWPGRLVGLAAIIAALALLVFALRYAGLIGPTPLAVAPAAQAPLATGVAGLAETAPPMTSSPTSPLATAPVLGGESTVQPAGYPGRTPDPTSGPTSTAAASAGELVVEDWKRYDTGADLAGAFSTNTAVPDNDLDLTLSRLSGGALSGAMAGVKISYTIVISAPNDYVGFQRDLDPAEDWSGRRALVAWVDTSDHSDRQLVIQWHEASDEVWRHRVRLSELDAGPVSVTIPLTADEWEWADWSVKENGRLDLGRVNHFGVFVGHAGPGAGELRLGRIGVVR